MTRTAFQPTVQLKIEVAPGTLIGPGKIALLEAIRSTGSVSAACRATSISYRKTRDLLDALNATFEGPVIEATKGGNKGGGTTLTPLGEALIECYRNAEAAANRAAIREMINVLRSSH